MEKTLLSGNEKIQQICNALRKETLEPAQAEGEHIIAEAKKRAEQIVNQAKAEAEAYHNEMKKKIDQERAVFKTSLQQAGKQSVEELRQEIESLFREQLLDSLSREMREPELIAKLLTSIVSAIEKEGIQTELTAVVPQSTSVEMINQLLTKQVVERLKEQSVTLGKFSGGVQVKLLDKRMTLEVTDKVLCDILSKYLRKDFREMIFTAPKK